MNVAKNYRVSPWFTLTIGIAVSVVIPAIVGMVTGNGYYALAALILTLVFVFNRGLKQSIVPLGSEGVVILLHSRRLTFRKTEKIDEEEIPVMRGPVLGEGTHWLPFMHAESIEVSQIIKDVAVKGALTKDKQSVDVSLSLTLYVANVHQILNNKDRLGGALIGICKLAEDKTREAIGMVESLSLFGGQDEKKNQEEKILLSLRKREFIYGIDVVRLEVTHIDLSEGEKKALETRKQIEIFKEAGLEGRAFEDAVAGLTGVKIERKETKESKDFKFDFGDRTAEIIGTVLKTVAGNKR